MDDLVTWLMVEYAALGILGLVGLVGRIRERSALRRLALHVFTQHPVANLAPPTFTELRAPTWAGWDAGRTLAATDVRGEATGSCRLPSKRGAAEGP